MMRMSEKYQYEKGSVHFSHTNEVRKKKSRKDDERWAMSLGFNVQHCVWYGYYFFFIGNVPELK